MPSHFLTNNPHDHLKIAQKLYIASLTHSGHSFVHNPIKQAQERPLKNNTPLSPPSHSNLGTEEAILQKTSKATCSSPPGVSVLLSCLSAIPPSFYLFVFYFYSTLPSLWLYTSLHLTFCSYSHMDTIHIVPSVEA